MPIEPVKPVTPVTPPRPLKREDETVPFPKPKEKSEDATDPETGAEVNSETESGPALELPVEGTAELKEKIDGKITPEEAARRYNQNK